MNLFCTLQTQTRISLEDLQLYISKNYQGTKQVLQNNLAFLETSSHLSSPFSYLHTSLCPYFRIKLCSLPNFSMLTPENSPSTKVCIHYDTGLAAVTGVQNKSNLSKKKRLFLCHIIEQIGKAVQLYMVVSIWALSILFLPHGQSGTLWSERAYHHICAPGREKRKRSHFIDTHMPVTKLGHVASEKLQERQGNTHYILGSQNLVGRGGRWPHSSAQILRITAFKLHLNLSLCE